MAARDSSSKQARTRGPGPGSAALGPAAGAVPPGRASGARRRAPGGAARLATRERLLDGALEAIARHGLAKVGIQDASRCAGVSRGTAYRYFRSFPELLAELGRREADRFVSQVWQQLEQAPPERRLAVAMDLALRMAREHPLLQRLPETDPGRVLRSLRERYPEIRAMLDQLLGAHLESTAPVAAGLVTRSQLVDWTTRMLITTFLFPDPDLSAAVDGFSAIYELLTPAVGEDGEPDGGVR